MQIKYFAGIIFCSALILLTLIKTTGDSPAPQHLFSNGTMVDAALHFLSLTDDAQKDSLLFAFEDEERTHWNFVPDRFITTKRREGLPVKEMSTAQRHALHALLQSILSTKGYLKTTGILHLERILAGIDNDPEYRDPEKYYLTIFGTPSMETPWGWRFEGHHISLNFSSVENEVAVVPAFMGSNPSLVPSGPYTGLRVLHEEIDVARALMATLSPAQKSKVIIADEAPREIITRNDREAMLSSYEGLRYDEMEPQQQAILRSLIDVYAGNVKDDVARVQMDRIEKAGFDKIYFAWAGSLEIGEAHYYRVHGPTMLIEYDNTQTNANHIHSSWRDLTNDFGRDLLHKHYQESGTGHGH